MLEELIEKMKACKVALALGGAGLLAAGVVGSQVLARPAEPADFPVVEASSSQPKEEVVAEQEPEVTTILVDVKGAVVREGLYELPAGSRVNDAVKAAGGLLETADKTAINLAQKLSDEAVVYVASQGEAVPAVAVGLSGVSSPAAGNASGKVNLNTADLDQLQTITGIGAKRAQDIIDYRESSGGFTSVDDLKNVSGIGDKTLEKIREEVTVD